MPAGRPTVMTPETVNKLNEAFAMGCTDVEACLFADISKQTLYDYQAKNPQYIDLKQSLKENVKLHARMNLSKSIIVEGDVDNSKWYLERKAKDEFSTKTEQDVTSKGEQIKDATTHILGLLPTEALEKALEDAKRVTNSPVNSDDNTTE